MSSAPTAVRRHPAPATSRRGAAPVYLGVISLLGFLLFAAAYLAGMEISDFPGATAPAWSTVLSLVGLVVAVAALVAAVVTLVRPAK